MSVRQRLAASAVLALGLGAVPVSASELFDACAAKAASSYEQGYAATGLDSGAIDTAAAIEACTAALAEAPDSPALKAWGIRRRRRAIWSPPRAPVTSWRRRCSAIS